MASGDPDYVVVRHGPDMPEEWFSPSVEGKWFDRSQMPSRESAAVAAGNQKFRERGGVVSSASAIPTGRFEVREDGAVAEVWELRPSYV